MDHGPHCQMLIRKDEMYFMKNFLKNRSTPKAKKYGTGADFSIKRPLFVSLLRASELTQ